MYIVKFENNDSIEEFNAVDIKDLMLLIVEYIGNNKNFFERAMKGFENDVNKEKSYIKLFNRLYAYNKIETIYKVKEVY